MKWQELIALAAVTATLLVTAIPSAHLVKIDPAPAPPPAAPFTSLVVTHQQLPGFQYVNKQTLLASPEAANIPYLAEVLTAAFSVASEGRVLGYHLANGELHIAYKSEYESYLEKENDILFAMKLEQDTPGHTGFSVILGGVLKKNILTRHKVLKGLNLLSQAWTGHNPSQVADRELGFTEDNQRYYLIKWHEELALQEPPSPAP